MQNQSLGFYRRKPLAIEKEQRQGRATAHSGHHVPDKPFPPLPPSFMSLVPSAILHCVCLSFIDLNLGLPLVVSLPLPFGGSPCHSGPNH